VNSLPLLKDSSGRTITVRVGRYGPYLERPALDAGPDGAATERANLPEDLPPDEVTAEAAEALFGQAAAGDKELGVDPATGRTIVAKDGRYGPYVTEVLPEGTPTTGKNAVKPRTGSLLKTMSLETITLADALRLLSLPRLVGTDADGVEITAQNGRYGPYLKKGTDSRSLPDEESMFTVTLDEALALYAQPKTRGRSAAAKPPLKELGVDPNSGKPMVIKEGRFGPYVTDGEYNASLRKGDAVETFTSERGAELLAEKRAKGPAPKRAKKAPAAGSSKSGGGTAAKKPATRKAAAAAGK
jgi:DNA topoisomerase-1